MQRDDKEKMYRFGTDYFPADMPETYKWQPKSTEADFKGLQVRSRNVLPLPGAFARLQPAGCCVSETHPTPMH